MRTYPMPGNREDVSTRPGVLRTIEPYVNPFRPSNQLKWTAANYLWNASIWENATRTGLNWQGLTGFRWAGGGTAARGAGLFSQSATAGRYWSMGPAKIGSLAVKQFYGAEGAEAFYQRGAKGLLELLEKQGRWKGATSSWLYKLSHVLAGGEETKLAAVKGGKVAAKKFGIGELGKRVTFFTASKSALKIAGTTAKIANWATIALVVAELGVWGGKVAGKFIDRRMSALANKLHGLTNTEAYIAPQLVNKYSITMREAALQEIHRSSFSPKNMLLGKEASLYHR